MSYEPVDRGKVVSGGKAGRDRQPKKKLQEAIGTERMESWPKLTETDTGGWHFPPPTGKVCFQNLVETVFL